MNGSSSLIDVDGRVFSGLALAVEGLSWSGCGLKMGDIEGRLERRREIFVELGADWVSEGSALVF